VVVRGEMFEHLEHSQHLRFEFETDQTAGRASKPGGVRMALD